METNCSCDLCRGLDAKRAAAVRWLGNRWLLTKSFRLTAVTIDVQAIPAQQPAKLRLVK